jgi:hypothetical protein
MMHGHNIFKLDGWMVHGPTCEGVKTLSLKLGLLSYYLGGFDTHEC